MLEHVWDPDAVADLNVVEVYAGYVSAQDRRAVRPERAADRARGGLPARGRRRLTMVMWWRRRSLRARLTLATSAGLALALALAAVLLVSALHASLVRDLDVSARQGAVEVAALLEPEPAAQPGAGRAGGRSPSRCSTPPAGSPTSRRARTGWCRCCPPQARAAARTGQARTLAGPPLGLPSMLRVVAVGAAGITAYLRDLLHPGQRQPGHAGPGPGHRDAAAVRPAGPGHLAAHRVHAAADRRAAPGRRRGDADRRAA